MTTIQEKANNLIQEKNQLIARFNEINGALQILNELAEEETTENES